MADDPSTYMASLINAIQTGRCAVSDLLDFKFVKPDSDIDITAPVFWFDKLFDTDSPLFKDYAKNAGESLSEMYQDDARDLVLNDQFRLPFPKCFFVYLCGEVLPSERLVVLEDGVRYVNVVYCDQDQATFDVHCTSFMRVIDPGRQRDDLGKPIDGWMVHPLKWNFGSHVPRGSIETSLRNGVTVFSGTEPSLLLDLTADLTCVLVSVVLMNEPKAFSALKLDAGPVHAKANKRRVKSGAKPLADVTYIKLLAPIPFPSRKAVTTRSGMTPHDRRATVRHYKSGKVVYIGPQKIKGGSAKQQTYKVTI